MVLANGGSILFGDFLFAVIFFSCHQYIINLNNATLINRESLLMYGVWKSFFLRNIDNHFHGFQTHGIDMVDNLMFDVFEMFHIYVTILRKCIIMFISNSLLSIKYLY